MYNTTHFFEVKGNKYALDFRNLIYFLLDDETESALHTVLTNNENSPNNTSLPVINELVKSGYFISRVAENEIPLLDYETLNISFAPVHDCNFACKYCYARGGEGTLNYQKKFDEKKIDSLFDYIYNGKYSCFQKYKFDFVSGGEPLLDMSIMEYFLKNMRYMDKIHNKQTTVLIVTNGTLLTEKNISVLDKYDVFLGISLDGSELIHNSHRLYKNGTPTYNDVVNGISILHSSSASSKIKDAWAMTVVASDTGSLVDVMETCFNLGLKRMQMQLLRVPRTHPLSFNEANIPRLKNNYDELIDHILKHVTSGDLSRLKMIANDNDSFGKYIRRLLLRNVVYYRCFAGKNKIAVTASGEVYPCDSFCGEKSFCLDSIDGTFNNDSILKIFEKAHYQNRPYCSGCWARQICGGDCYYNSYLINGNIYDPDPIVCEMNRFFIERTIDLLLKIQVINPNYITYLASFLNRR